MVDEPATGGGAEREAERWGDPKERDGEANPALRGDGAKGGEHHSCVAQLEADQQQCECRLPAVLREPKHSEHDHFDECAARDDRYSPVALGPDAPEGNQRKSEQEECCVQISGPGRHLGRRHVHGPEVKGQKSEDVGNGERLDSRGDPEEDQQRDPPRCPRGRGWARVRRHVSGLYRGASAHRGARGVGEFDRELAE